jgi:hypothetical protein
MGDIMTGFSLGVAAAANHGTNAVINTDPDVFLRVVERNRDGLVVMSQSGLLRTKYCYLTSYKGLTFYCESTKRLNLSPNVELLTAESIEAPGDGN